MLGSEPPRSASESAPAPRISITSEDRASMELSFTPNVELISMVRQFVTNFYEAILKDPDITSRLGVAAHELLENAVKFSCDGVTHIRVEVRKAGDKHEVTVATRNRAQESHVAALKELMDELTSATDPLAYYQLLMRRSLKRTDGSGLGLGRIRAEAEMNLNCEIIEGNLVQLRATGQ